MTLSGLDAHAAEMFMHLITGASVPDEGAVVVAGHDTRTIATDTEWLASLDRFGIVTAPRGAAREDDDCRQSRAAADGGDRSAVGSHPRRRRDARARGRPAAGAARSAGRLAFAGRAGARPPGPCAGTRPAAAVARTPDGRSRGPGGVRRSRRRASPRRRRARPGLDLDHGRSRARPRRGRAAIQRRREDGPSADAGTLERLGFGERCER